MEAYLEPARKIPLSREADVVVVGGGPAGIMAALAAARTGAGTLLIERYGFLGGTATAGLVTTFNGFRNERPPNHVQTVRGIAQELVDRLLRAGGACGRPGLGHCDELRTGESPYAVHFDPEVLKSVALEMLCEANVKMMLHTLFCDAPTDGRRVSVVIVENKSGRQAVRGKLYVDATGDGDVAERAGARYAIAEKTSGELSGVTLMYRVVGVPEPAKNERRVRVNGITTRWGPYLPEVNGSNAEDLTAAEIAARREVGNHMAKLRQEFPDATLVQTGDTIGVRETRRILGLYTISEEDCLTGRPHEDSVAISSNPVPSYYGERRFLDHLGFEIPYRSLIPADLDNVLLSGRCICASRPAFQSARAMAGCMAISQASGTAAALCAKAGCRPADLNVGDLQKRLEEDGAVVRVPPEERE